VIVPFWAPALNTRRWQVFLFGKCARRTPGGKRVPRSFGIALSNFSWEKSSNVSGSSSLGIDSRRIVDATEKPLNGGW